MRRSPLEKPSSTRAGGRGVCWGLPHCLEEKEKTKSWVNPRNFQVSMRQNLCQKSIFGCEEKTEISSPSRINWTSPPTLCEHQCSDAKISETSNFYFVKMLPLDTHPSSFILSINLMRNIILKLLDKKNCAEILSRSNERV